MPIFNEHTSEKFSIIAIPRLPLDWNKVPMDGALSDRFAFAQKLPFTLERHWREWIGTTRADLIDRAQLLLVVHQESSRPEVFDDENKEMDRQADRLYQGLLFASTIWIDGEVVRLSGSSINGNIDLRQVSTLPRISNTHYFQRNLIGISELRLGAELAKSLGNLPRKSHLRLSRILNAFYSGLADTFIRERLHQFCRCIEGLIAADPGQTTSQFKSRTELFVGPRHHEFMGSMYENRSATEHMNDPVISGASEKEKFEQFWKMMAVSEEIARYCLQNILLSHKLLDIYKSEATMRTFWSLDKEAREILWDKPSFDIDTYGSKLQVPPFRKDA